MNLVKVSSLIKKYVCDEWCPQVARYKKEREFIQHNIIKHLQSYKSDMLYKFGPIGKVLVNVNGKCYIVDFEYNNVYINDDVHNIKQYLIPDDSKEEKYWYFRTNEASLYKNYTNNYEDIRIALKIVSEYLTNLRSIEIKNPWNISQKIKETIDYIRSFRSSPPYQFYFAFNYVSSSQDSCLFLDSNNVSNCYERLKFDTIDNIRDMHNFHSFNSDNFELYNDILVSNKKNCNSYALYVALRKLTSFLKYFDINKKIFPIINEKEEVRKFYEEISSHCYPNIQEEKIKELLKKVDSDLLNLVNTKLQQSNYNYEKFKNSLYFNFSETDAIKLFYNPRVFRILLPEDFLTHKKCKVSIYVINHMFNAEDIQERKISIKNIDNTKNIDYEDALDKIEIRFYFDNKFKGKWFFSLSLSTYLSKLNNNNVSDFFRFIRSDGYISLLEKDLIREYLRSLIVANKLQLLQLIFNKMEEHVDMGRIYVKPSDMSLSDMFLTAYAEDYFDNCVQKI